MTPGPGGAGLQQPWHRGSGDLNLLPTPTPTHRQPQGSLHGQLAPQELPHRVALRSGSQLERHVGQEKQLALSWDLLPDIVAEGLNGPHSKRLFRDLVSLQVPEEQVLNAALKEKLALLPPQARESPHLTLDGLSPLHLLWPRPSEDTFLMHRSNTGLPQETRKASNTQPNPTPKGARKGTANKT
ncbi:unnamed protein product [Nyctereutes procyonoides]|uniref:(raccoon dog) hypothetical protein n=1 Tax=Nyctereutes procyonoides TaxID=34880 RepID=A0A811YXC8_NYCPR|nr:unnamed protein product [Nyctereutes procyonoides]